MRQSRLECLEPRILLAFSEIAELSLTGTKDAWGDVDNNGWTDLYDGRTIWRNDSGLLTPLQIIDSASVEGEESNEGVLGDFDNDGFLDLFAYETYQLWQKKKL